MHIKHDEPSGAYAVPYSDNLKQRTLVRLEPHVYVELERKLSKLLVTSSTTQIEVGFQLGIQAVLKELRAGYVVEAL